MTGEAASALSQMLSRHTGLQSLNLSDTALGDEGIAAVVQGLPPCADSLQVGAAEQHEGSSSLRHTPRHCRFNSEASWDLLSLCAGHLERLQLPVVGDWLLRPALHARGKHDDVSCRESHVLCLLKDLAIGSRRADAGKHPGCSSVISDVESAMQDLNLALNEVTEAGAESLAAFLQGRTALQRLLLRENELGDDGAVALAGALQVRCTLARRQACRCAPRDRPNMHWGLPAPTAMIPFLTRRPL